jgi:hypothetical protein
VVPWERGGGGGGGGGEGTVQNCNQAELLSTYFIYLLLCLTYIN